MRLVLLLTVLAATGCLAPSSSECGGGLCPPGLKCIVDEGTQYCVSPTCGNGEVDVGEACDDGNNKSFDGCPANCISDLTCGNGLVDPGEGCDDNGRTDHDGCSSTCALETPAWLPLDAGPPARSGAAMAYDAVRGRVVLFGGCSSIVTPSGYDAYCGGTMFNETWEWDGVRWNQVIPAAGAPIPRFGHTMAFDAARGRVVLHGGCGGSVSPAAQPCTLLDDTWEWDGAMWSEKTPSVRPPKNYDHAMVYDGARRVVVLVAGCLLDCSQDGPALDTWEWEGTTWTQKPKTLLARYDRLGKLAFDPTRGKVVMFGGTDGMMPNADTLEWDGESWLKRSPVTSPPARFDHVMTYDPEVGKVIVVGGCIYAPMPIGPYHCTNRVADIWEWDGNNWNPRLTRYNPPPRDGHAIAYDAARERVVLFGGESTTGDPRGDTWELGDGGDWHERLARVPASRAFASAVYDDARSTTLLFGGMDLRGPFARGDTWEWNGSSWTEHTTAGPSARLLSAIGYDRVRDRVVLFGGCLGPNVQLCPTAGDTWEWTGTGWTERMPTTAPSPRIGAAIGYDAIRGRIVLFGGCAGTNAQTCTPVADTWEWDGANWTQKTPATSPPARWLHTLASDTTRSRIVLAGGVDGAQATLADAWEWDGTNWIARPALPEPRAAAAAIFDEAQGKVVLFGGCKAVSSVTSIAALDCATSSYTNDLLTFAGTAWTTQPAPVPARAAHVVAYDARRAATVTFGGFGSSRVFLNDTWELSPTGWQKRSDATSPRGFSELSMTYDVLRKRVVSYAEDGATWEWTGEQWLQRTSSSATSIAGPVAYDAGRGNVVLFGADRTGQLQAAETWTWDGTLWTKRASTDAPSPRLHHEMVYDSVRDNVVLFGGHDSTGANVNDTWLWNGSNWTRATPSRSPPGRCQHVMAFDVKRGRVVLFGGRPEPVGSPLADTWEWDGTDWTDMTSTMSPPPRNHAAMFYDPVREHVVLYGGGSLGGTLGDTWEWDGAIWKKLNPTTSPPLVPTEGAAYDVANDRAVMVTADIPSVLGNDTNPVDTWFMRYDAPRVADSCATGFDGDSDGRIGCADPNCAGMCDPLCASIDRCDGPRPSCGDGTCSTLEDCRLCPFDCGTCLQCGDLHCDNGEACSTCPGDCGACP